MIEMSTQDTVNIVLLRRIGFFALFNPKTKKVFNCNIYRVCCVLVTFIIECLTVYGMIGLFVETEGKLDNVNLSNLLVYYQVNILCLVEISTFIYRAEDIWHLYKVTGVNFLTNRRSRQHKHILYEYREVSIMATNYLCKFLVLAVSAWILYPQLLNFNTFTGVHDIDITKTKRFYNVFDIRFPVTTRTYNDYYYLFYLIEVFMVTSMGYLFVMFNTMFISFSFVLMAQYEIVANDFASIGDEHTNPDDRKMTVIGSENSYTEKCITDLKSIISDHARLYRMLKLYYSILWIILVPSVVITSGGIVVLTYSLVLIFTSTRSTTILNILKLSTAIFYVLFDLFFLCYLVNKINIKKESVRFGMYSCNWTKLNLKFKKLLLLTMQMCDSHKAIVKISPKIIVNLQFYANVLIRSYNILSVMLKSHSRNKHQI